MKKPCFSGFKVLLRNLIPIRERYLVKDYIEMLIQKRCVAGVTNDLQKVKNLCQEFLAPVRNKNVLQRIAENFESSLELALNPSTRKSSSLKCFNTHLQNVNVGQVLEKGEHLSMHLGGTVLNFMRITIDGPNQFTPRSVTKRVPEIMKKSSGEPLFEFMAEKLRDFVWAFHSFRTEHVPLVFCFSFPLEQQSLDRGTIQGWAKGYLCEKTVGKNVNTLLRMAALKKELSLDIKAIINDIGGGYVVGRTKTKLCSGSIILGSGTNAGYLESVKKVIGFQGDFTSPYVLINTEWGGYGDKGELDDVVTEFDQTVDTTSINPGVHLFEKMTSGMYIGEIVRLIFIKLIEDKLLFNGEVNQKLLQKNIFKAVYLTDFAEDQDSFCKRVLDQVLKVRYTQEDVEKIKEVIWSVGERVSLLVAACTVGLSHKMGHPVVAFAAEGRFINNGLPNFLNIQEKLSSLTDKRVKKIYIIPTFGSALKGAALLAASLTT